MGADESNSPYIQNETNCICTLEKTQIVSSANCSLIHQVKLLLLAEIFTHAGDKTTQNQDYDG